jgi:hypothetical protein
VFARFALLVAPSDPLVSTAAARHEALGWLRNQVVPRGFQVAIVGGGASPLADLEAPAAKISPGDSVLVHVSGRLATADSLALSGTPLPLSALADLLAARNPGCMSLILDLLRDEESATELEAGDLPTEIARSLGAERGYSVLASVRTLAGAPDRIAFTRQAMPPLDDGGPPSSEALLSAMHDRAAAAGENGTGAQSFALLRGAPDATIDGLVAQAAQASDWSRVVELRLDRVETLSTVAQRAQELAGVARVLLNELEDAGGAVDVLERARALDPKRATVLEALRHAYEASGRAVPIDPAEYANAFAVHQRAGQTDAALLDAMLLDELGVAEPLHQSMVEQARAAGPVQVLRPLDGGAWDALRAPGFDEALAPLLTALHDAAVAVRLENRPRRSLLDSAARLDAESTVSAVRTLHWAARVLGVECPDLYAAREDTGEAVTQVAGERPSISLAPRVLSGTSSKQLAFLAGRALTWYRPEYHCMLYYPTLEELRELVGAAVHIANLDGRSTDSSPPSTSETRRALSRRLSADERAAISDAVARLGPRAVGTGLEHWIRSAELTAARAGLFLCGELKIAVAGVRGEASAPGRPTAERVTSDLVAFCASPAHAALRAQFLRLSGQSLPPPPPGR